MRVLGHGVDLLSVGEFERIMEASNAEWIKKIYTDREQADADDPPVGARYYAGRFAGKEAVAKALGTGFAGEITWRGIEILRNHEGAPYVRLHDEVLRLAMALGIEEWAISISHAGDLTLASVIAFGP